MNYKSKISSYVIGGEYKGHQWLIRKSLFRFLGYIRLTERDITILTHGGGTYIGTLSDEFGVFVGFDTAHAILSASASSRWLHCTPSATCSREP